MIFVKGSGIDKRGAANKLMVAAKITTRREDEDDALFSKLNFFV